MVLRQETMKAFEKPSVKELKRLMDSGIMHNGITHSFEITIFSIDTIAWPLLRNTTQLMANMSVAHHVG